MLKHGDVRDDGMMFWGMSGKHQDWRSPDRFYTAKKRNGIDPEIKDEWSEEFQFLGKNLGVKVK